MTREQVKRLQGQGRHVDKTPALLIAVLFGNLVVNILFFSLRVVVAIASGKGSMFGITLFMLQFP